MSGAELRRRSVQQPHGDDETEPQGLGRVVELESAAEADANKADADTADDGHSAFECNICFDLATEPVVTFCGHLYCWPCILKWLQMHSMNPACPVCKAALSRDRMVPLYGRGGGSSGSAAAAGPSPPNDGEASPTSGTEGARGSSTSQRGESQQASHGHASGGGGVPNASRPAGQRTEPAGRPHRPGQDMNAGFGIPLPGANMGGTHFQFGGFNFHAGFGVGTFPSLFGMQFTNVPQAQEPLTPEQQQQRRRQQFLSQMCFFLGVLILFSLFMYH